ncbi:hypothetical protein KIMH_15210 [Bombiscardovia apis]|uniref:O-antigen polysaccharide polymerase Wzy n=2 Tax=Bombiscardovia apis TaxID=2932182 RepID=A0ABN6SHA7_9BIFI|nr:hypothetical protein KIMH_15210 [Bombiscardovia apis]
MRYVGNNGPYEGYIAYTGPQFGAEVLSVYYGYFPLSFNNLNLTLKTGIQAHDFWGLYSFRGFYFGFCQLDNLLGLDADAPSALRVYSTGAATVNTGFYEYFYDYGVFCFIPIAAMIAICWYLTKRMQKSPSLFLATQYCCFVPLVFFESFQNVFFGDIMLWEVIFMYILLRLLFKREDTETERKIREKLASVCSKLPFLKSKRHEVSSSNAVEM